MSELSDDTRALLARGRGGAGLSGDRRAALRAGVLAKIAAGSAGAAGAGAAMGGGGAGTASVAGKVAAVAWAPLAMKVVGVAIVVGIASGGAVLATRHERSASLVTTTTTTATATATATTTATAATSVTTTATNAPVPTMEAAPSSPAPSAMPVVATAASTEPRRATSVIVAPSPSAVTYARATASEGASEARSAAAPASGSEGATKSAPKGSEPSVVEPAVVVAAPPRPMTSLEAEALSLQDAHRALVAGQAGRALQLLDDHARRFPTSALEPERSADRVFALCALGQQATAHSAGESFLTAHPNGPLAARVRGSCATR